MLPDLLNLYGDGGNVRILEQRLRWRGIPVEVRRIQHGEAVDFSQVDLVFMGGGPDREQKLASEQLLAMRDELAVYVEGDGPLLAICGGYQILGRQWLWGDEPCPVSASLTWRPAAPAHLPTVSSTTWCWNLPWPRILWWATRTTPAAPTWARASRLRPRRVLLRPRQQR